MIKEDRITIIKQRLNDAFSPTYLAVFDESDAHRGHAGYGGGGRHFAIEIDALCFKSTSRVDAHRKIYAVLNDLIPEKIHALKIKIL